MGMPRTTDLQGVLSQECAYSFNDLFFAALKRQMTAEEKRSFSSLSQDEINEKVGELALKAGWGTMDKTGTDGRMYRAFCPLWAPK